MRTVGIAAREARSGAAKRGRAEISLRRISLALERSARGRRLMRAGSNERRGLPVESVALLEPASVLFGCGAGLAPARGSRSRRPRDQRGASDPPKPEAMPDAVEKTQPPGLLGSAAPPTVQSRLPPLARTNREGASGQAKLSASIRAALVIIAFAVTPNRYPLAAAYAGAPLNATVHWLRRLRRALAELL